MEYSAQNPEFKIAFNSTLPIPNSSPGLSENGLASSGMLRESDGAFVFPINNIKGSKSVAEQNCLYVVPQKTTNGKPSYDWADAKVIPLGAGEPSVDVLAQDGRYYVLRNSDKRHDFGGKIINAIEAYDDNGNRLWTRGRSDITDVTVKSVGDGLVATLDLDSGYAGYMIWIRNAEGDLVTCILPKWGADSWDPATLRLDADSAMIWEIQAYKLTGLTTIKTAAASLDLVIPTPALSSL
jgi:hypothetical protein